MLALGTLSNNRQESPVAGAGIPERIGLLGSTPGSPFPALHPDTAAFTLRE